ncbi:MAG: metal ABC transporter ATP-binding protein [Firmicutes bacterium]|nr:metal ABC transporter ATP-binding protein [Bacillota bacterium]
MQELVLKGRDIGFRYGSNYILDKCSFDIYKGDFSVITGPNGSGKSTLLKICLGLLKQQEGTVELFGKPIEKYSDWKNIGYMPQRVEAFNTRFPATVEEVVKAPLYSGSAFFSTNKKAINNIVEKSLSSVGMGDYKKRLIGRLSVGQQQRVFIAKALANNPAIIFMDEPTAGIDNKSEKEFYDLLYSLNRVEGITIIMVTHDYADVESMANRVFCLSNGTIDEKCEEVVRK